MHIAVLDNNLWFPNADDASEDGLLAIGGDITTERLLLAYSKGVFPWYNDDLPLWWNPNPRFVLYPQKLKVSKSMKQVIKQQQFNFTTNTAFKQVIIACQKINRKDHDGTWINEKFIGTYTKLHTLGYAHSAEAWQNNNLVGGLYGVKLGNIFFGESMFSYVNNASKFAFINFVQQLMQQNVVLIDCQIYTEHLESLGAEMIDRNLFLKTIAENINGI